MKKILSVLLAFVLVATCAVGFAGCSKSEEKQFEIVLITDGGTVTDGAYNQSAWNGVKSYADENNVSYRYYQPNVTDEGLSIDTIRNYVELSVKNGAKSIVFPGETFAVASYEIAPDYSDVNFILVDAYPHSADDTTPKTIANVMSVDFDRLQAGFLAGYASVSMGYTKLGYLGSVSESDSSSYGAGYVQGASYAADEAGIPVSLDYANYDADDLDYDYSFTIRPVYQKVSDCKETTYKVVVDGGIGSGVYADGENVTITADNAPEGKVFDHWEVKSNTEGVKDKKVNISSKKNSTMNLLVGDCDCTITAVWADADTVPVTVTQADGETVDTVYYAPKDSSISVAAPAPTSGMVFDHWETEDTSIVDDLNSLSTKVNVSDKEVTLVPVYVKSTVPTFDVTVEQGTGSGSYRSGDEVNIVADAPEDGYMFYCWENVDNQGLSTGIAMDNEYCYSTTFSMVDRYSSIVEAMYDDGIQVVFGGGNSQSDSIFTATWNFDYQVYAFGSGIDQQSMGNCLASVVNDYGEAVKLALSSYNGGTTLTGNCENKCIYVTNISEENTSYSAMYDALANGSITVNAPTGDVRTVFNSKCLTLNYWVK